MFVSTAGALVVIIGVSTPSSPSPNVLLRSPYSLNPAVFGVLYSINDKGKLKENWKKRDKNEG